MESVYWVFTLKCNDRCAHCYNNSAPEAAGLPLDELLRVVPNLPAGARQVILSGGEPTVEMAKLLALLGALRERYGPGVPLLLQTNGDLLDAAKLAALLEAGVDRVDVVSMDRYHKHQGCRRDLLAELFREAGMHEAGPQVPPTPGPTYAFWGATEELWLKGNWARGRALENDAAKLDPDHNFCALWSGAIGFLDAGSRAQEVHVQLTRVYPCCPTTYLALGDAREEPVEDILARYRGHPDWEALNRGAPAELGEDRELATRRIRELGDVCLWCDEYLRTRYPEDAPRGAARPGDQRTPFDV